MRLSTVQCITPRDRKSTRLNSSHPSNSYAVFCLKKKKITVEHGIGIEKLRYIPMIFDAASLGALLAVRKVFDPEQRVNPGKVVFFFDDTACAEIYTLSLHDALPI